MWAGEGFGREAERCCSLEVIKPSYSVADYGAKIRDQWWMRFLHLETKQFDPSGYDSDRCLGGGWFESALRHRLSRLRICVVLQSPSWK